MTNVIDFEQAKADRMTPVNYDRITAEDGKVVLTFYRDGGEPGVALTYAPNKARMLARLIESIADTAEQQEYARKNPDAEPCSNCGHLRVYHADGPCDVEAECSCAAFARSMGWPSEPEGEIPF